jgi:hypothetical protein
MGEDAGWPLAGLLFYVPRQDVGRLFRFLISSI